jgi:hypothetical protein
VHTQTAFRLRRTLSVVVASVVVVVAAVSTPSAAEEESPDPRQEREALRSHRAELALQIDALEADDAQVTRALEDLDDNVRGQQSLLANARRSADDAARLAEEAQRAADDKAIEMHALRSRMSRLAVDAYVNPPLEDYLDRLKAETATIAAQKEALLEVGAIRASDLVDELRAVKHEHERQRSRADQAREEAIRRQGESERRLSELSSARQQQQEFAGQVELRLSAKLAEADALAAVDADLAAQITAQQMVLAEQLRQLAPPPPPPDEPSSPGPSPSPPPGGPPTAPPPPPAGSPAPPSPPPTAPAPVPLTTVRGITVHTSIAGQLDAMLGAAAASGIVLAGSGYRDINRQIQLRRQNCGTSDYAIWQMPASQCSPPTAIPGQSMHERGLAVDFTWNGTAITSRSSPAFVWLAANAARYGFYNLPSEPWHWSTTGS